MAAVPGSKTGNPRFALRPSSVHKDWYGIVLGGSHWSKGMPALPIRRSSLSPKPVMTVADADAVHAYVIDQAWKAYKVETGIAHIKREN